MAAKLTEAQRRVLVQISKGETYPSIRFQTADSLRRLGLVDRETHHVIKRVYANQRGEHLQFDVDPEQAVVWHYWYVTDAGRSALPEGGLNG